LRRSLSTESQTSFSPSALRPGRPFPPPSPSGVGSPASTATTSGCDSSRLLRPRFLLVRSAVPLGHSVFAPCAAECTPRGPGASAWPVPRTGSPRGRHEVSQVPGGPPCRRAALYDPGGASAPGVAGRWDSPSAAETASAPSFLCFGAESCGPSDSLSTLRRPGHPDTTQDSLTSGCHALAGIVHPVGPFEVFRTCFSVHASSSQTFAWRNSADNQSGRNACAPDDAPPSSSSCALCGDLGAIAPRPGASPAAPPLGSPMSAARSSVATRPCT